MSQPSPVIRQGFIFRLAEDMTGSKEVIFLSVVGVVILLILGAVWLQWKWILSG